jgi:hypothetical protein
MAEITREGRNPLGEVPFIWLENKSDIVHPHIGISDIQEISYVQASIVRNISSAEEIIKYAAFPMLRKPMRTEADPDETDVVGVTAVQEFNPEFGEAGKPDWLESSVKEPIAAIMEWIQLKIDEIYRLAHLSGIHGQRKSSQVSSGIALRQEFQQLNSVLTQKSNNMTEAEIKIIDLWLKWENKEELLKEIEIKRSKNFSLDDLSVDLRNQVAAMKNVASKTFAVAVQKQLSRKITPDLADEEFTKIDAELEQNTPENPTLKEELGQEDTEGIRLESGQIKMKQINN